MRRKRVSFEVLRSIPRGEWLQSVADRDGLNLEEFGARYGGGASRQTVSRWFEGQWPGRRKQIRALCTSLGVTRQVFQNGPWSVLTSPGGTITQGGVVAPHPKRRWQRMTEVLARVLARAIEDTLVSRLAGLPESRSAIANAVRQFAYGLNKLGMNASTLVDMSTLIRQGAPVDEKQIAMAVEHSMAAEDLPQTTLGREAMADLVDGLASTLMPLKIDVSPLGDVADLLRKGGL